VTVESKYTEVGSKKQEMQDHVEWDLMPRPKTIVQIGVKFFGSSLEVVWKFSGSCLKLLMKP
jgi:hypothetical protein